MTTEEERCAEHRKFLKIDAAFHAGDLDALRAAFPPLLAALSCSRSVPGSEARPDVPEIIQLLLEFGADPAQRGINDYTALHMAVAEQNKRVVELLLAGGADPRLRTTIDECETPLEMARAAGFHDIVAILESAEQTFR